MRNWCWIQAGVLGILCASVAAQAQPAPGQPRDFLQDRDDSRFLRFFSEAEWYFSWGYSKQYWAPTDIHVSQPSLGNDFTIHGVRGEDFPNLNSQTIAGAFTGGLFGPQYNIRIGRFVNQDRTIAVELNFDHSKYSSIDGQTALVTGMIAGVPINANYVLDNKFFAYALH